MYECEHNYIIKAVIYPEKEYPCGGGGHVSPPPRAEHILFDNLNSLQLATLPPLTLLYSLQGRVDRNVYTKCQTESTEWKYLRRVLAVVSVSCREIARSYQLEYMMNISDPDTTLTSQVSCNWLGNVSRASQSLFMHLVTRVMTSIL